jgi:dTDP-glucose 4,6-dehydratase
MKKIVYVTGALGFIGSYVTEACLKKGWYVRGIDKCTYAANIDLLDEFKKYENFAFENNDINDLEGLYDCDYVINAAAETHVDNSITSSDVFLHSNINGVHRLLELIKSKKENKPILLHFSTDEVYGDIVSGWHTEGDILKPSNPYSATKAAADMLIKAWARTYGVPYVIVRPTNNYGCRQYVEKLIPKTCKYLTLGRKIPLHNGGTPVRVWLHARDTANAIIHIIESGAVNEIYNISGNYEDTNLNIVKWIVKLMNDDDDYEKYIDFSYKRSGQDLRYSIRDDKLKKLGWDNKCIFPNELKTIVKYYKDKFIW